MTGSRINPRMGFKSGTEESGGYLRKNDKPKSASSPDWRGMFYLVGYGWIWLSGWQREGDGEPLIKLLAEDMTDEQAGKFCAPKARRGGGPSTPRPVRHNGQIPANTGEDEIPF